MQAAVVLDSLMLSTNGVIAYPTDLRKIRIGQGISRASRVSTMRPGSTANTEIGKVRHHGDSWRNYGKIDGGKISGVRNVEY
jgi:hypothetical protein